MSQAWDKEKILSPYEESNLRPSDLCSDALPLSHKDSSVSKVSYEVLMTCILHTARMSNVDSVMFLTVMLYLYQWQSNGAQIQRSEVCFLMGTQNFFFVPRSWRNENTSFLILHRAQNLPSLLFCQELFCGKNPASRNFLLYCFYQGRGARHSRLC